MVNALLLYNNDYAQTPLCLRKINTLSLQFYFLVQSCVAESVVMYLVPQRSVGPTADPPMVTSLPSSPTREGKVRGCSSGSLSHVSGTWGVLSAGTVLFRREDTVAYRVKEVSVTHLLECIDDGWVIGEGRRFMLYHLRSVSPFLFLSKVSPENVCCSAWYSPTSLLLIATIMKVWRAN